MAEKPIIFSGEMVRAILDGRKTQTSKIIKLQAHHYNPDMLQPHIMYPCEKDNEFGDPSKPIVCPYGQVGDRLWMRETFLQEASTMGMPSGDYKDLWHSKIEYIADGAKARTLDPESYYPHQMVKRPSIHMPKWATRLWLEVTGVRVERVQDISYEDCEAEGIPQGIYSDKDNLYDKKGIFIKLWDSLNAKRGYSWETNPYVWVIEFKRQLQEM